MRFVQVNDNEVVASGNCMVTGEFYSVTVPAEGFLRWKGGECIQVAMPTVSPEDREFLISGTSPKGWNLLFSKD